ncbi:MAG: M20/M25/M40 family metallo-hydrolase [Planctomycetes bacterium]|nr:M20/M25/M40 family metallo-hydrolase [Planctomycetota bacterium]
MRAIANLRRLSLFTLAFASSCANPRHTDSVIAQPELRARRLEADVTWLSADEQEGRRAGTQAGLRAGEWIAQRMAELGLEPRGTRGYTQPFEVPKPVEVRPGSAVNGITDAAKVAPLFCATAGEVAGEIAWCGYGIVDASKGWNDFSERIDGKVALIVRGTPPDSVGTQPEAAAATSDAVHESAGWGNSGSLFLKVMTAKRQGALAVLVAPHPSQQSQPLPSFDVGRAAQSVLPALYISHELAAALVPGYDAAISAIDVGAPLAQAPRPTASARVVSNVARERGPATNVLGLLRGADSSRCVVLGAHYDHLGWGGEGSLDSQGGAQIHNGADDNASGTAVVLEVARALAAGPKPDCDVLFALWSGEELGLLGSEHWAKTAALELDSVVANLNLDMVGRAGDGKLAVLGAGSAEPFAAWLAELGPRLGLELDVSLSGQGVGGSDHQTFLKRKRPAVHFFSGLHGDYHKPSDDAERFEAEGAAKVAALALELTRRMAATRELAWVEPPAPTSAQPGQARAGGFRVWFGTVPEYAYDGKGLLLGGTSPGSPAEKAGMLAGDVLVQVGDIAIETIQDFVYALQTYKPGDVVLARFLRDGKTEEVRVTLATREAQ